MSNDNVNKNLQKIADNYYEDTQSQVENAPPATKQPPPIYDNYGEEGFLSKLFGILFAISVVIFWSYVFITWLF